MILHSKKFVIFCKDNPIVKMHSIFLFYFTFVNLTFFFNQVVCNYFNLLCFFLLRKKRLAKNKKCYLYLLLIYITINLIRMDRNQSCENIIKITKANLVKIELERIFS